MIDTVLYKYQFIDIYTTHLDINIKNLIFQIDEINDAKFVNFQTFEKMNKNNEIVASVFKRYELIREILRNT